MWSSASSDEEGGLRAGGSRQSTPRTPRKVSTVPSLSLSLSGGTNKKQCFRLKGVVLRQQHGGGIFGVIHDQLKRDVIYSSSRPIRFSEFFPPTPLVRPHPHAQTNNQRRTDASGRSRRSQQARPRRRLRPRPRRRPGRRRLRGPPIGEEAGRGEAGVRPLRRGRHAHRLRGPPGAHGGGLHRAEDSRRALPPL